MKTLQKENAGANPQNTFSGALAPLSMITFAYSCINVFIPLSVWQGLN